MSEAIRGSDAHKPAGTLEMGLPPRVFLYTLDQLAVQLDITERTIKNSYIYFEGRTTGSRSKGLMTARNIAPADEAPEWRVAEREFIRWLKVKGFRIYDRSVSTN